MKPLEFKTIFPLGDGKTIFAVTPDGQSWIGYVNRKTLTIDWVAYTAIDFTPTGIKP